MVETVRGKMGRNDATIVRGLFIRTAQALPFVASQPLQLANPHPGFAAAVNITLVPLR
jgi:hypothetical protein